MILNIPPTLSQIRAGNLRVPLQFNADLTSQYDSAKTQILSNGTSGVNLLLGVPSTGFTLIKSGIINLFSAGSTQGVQNQNSWGVGVYGTSVGGAGYAGLSSTGLSDILGNVPTGSSYKFSVQGVEKYRLSSTLQEAPSLSLGGTIGSSTDPGAGGLSLTNRVQFSGAGTADSTKTLIYADAASGNLYIGVPTGKSLQFLVNGAQRFYSDSSGLVSVGRLYANENLNFNGVGTITSTLTSLWADAAAGNLFSNIPTGKYEQHRVAGSGLLSLGRASSTQGDSYWSIGQFASDGTLYSNRSGIYATSSMVLNVPSGNIYSIDVNNVEKYRLSSTLLEAPAVSIGGTPGSSVDPGAGSLALTNRVQFAGTGTIDATKTLIYADAAAGNLSINTPSAKYFGLLVAGYTTYTFGYSSNLATTGANVFQLGDGSGSYIQSDGFGLLHRVSNTYAHTFKVNTTDVGYFDGSGLTVTKNIVSSNNSNAGDRTTNLDVQRYFNNIFWGWPASAYTCSVGAFNGSGYPFICFYGYHSATTNTIKRSSATNQPVWLQSLGGYLSIWQGSSGTADTDCTSTEKYRFAAALAEFDRLSLGGTIGSSTDPGAGGLYLTGSSNIRGGQKVAVSTKTTTYTATSSDYIILGNHASTPFTINLPAATGSGQVFIIKNINTAAVTVDANASETIDGSLTQVLATNNSITIVDYATGLWAII